MDEPISHLEARQRARMREELVDLHDKLETTTIYVTHDQVEAMTMADRIAVMNLGVLQQVGTPKEVYERPRTRFVGGFIGEPPMNFAECSLLYQDNNIYLESPSFKFKLAPHTAEKLKNYNGPSAVTMGLRPESIGVSRTASDDSVKSSVYVLEPQGERTLLSAKLGGDGDLFLIEVGPDFQAEPDDLVYLQFREPVHLFEPVEGMNLLY
jgi:multiple sugar transport system ATP-binding protein